MASHNTVTLGRRGREILWNPEFLRFAQHYLFEVFLCRVADPTRKGKIEKPYQYIENDFLKAREFKSWHELNAACFHWLKEIANCRVHRTTRQIPQDVWMAEREFLTALPDTSYPTYRQEVRRVHDDGTISVDGSRYSVPYQEITPRSMATVRVYSHYIELLNQQGHILATHRKPDLPGAMIIEPSHYPPIGSNHIEKNEQIEHRFLVRFPHAADFLSGLKKRMKSLYRVHLHNIFKLVQVYGENATSMAISRATRYANFNSHALARILKQRFPLISQDLMDRRPLGSNASVYQIGDIEVGSFDEYRQYSGGSPENEEEK